LDPAAPAVRNEPYLERLAAKYRISLTEADEVIDRMIEAGARNGVVLRFDRAQPANTFDAHRLLHLAAERGVQADLAERMFRATFTKGAALADAEVLVALAVGAGIDAADAGAVVAGDAFTSEVRADERRAAELGIDSVPFFVVAGSYGVAGAQPPEILVEVLDEAWTATATTTEAQPSS
jgi:predicted DsbA family dithiol-disulfide isomerase